MRRSTSGMLILVPPHDLFYFIGSRSLQFAPLDCPDAIDNFIGYWKPSLVLLMESELWPNLIMSAAAKGIAVALLNARMSLKSFNRRSVPLGLPLVTLMLSKLSLVTPLVNPVWPRVSCKWCLTHSRLCWMKRETIFGLYICVLPGGGRRGLMQNICVGNHLTLRWSGKQFHGFSFFK